jgi:hypothetical protein
MSLPVAWKPSRWMGLMSSWGILLGKPGGSRTHLSSSCFFVCRACASCCRYLIYHCMLISSAGLSFSWYSIISEFRPVFCEIFLHVSAAALCLILFLDKIRTVKFNSGATSDEPFLDATRSDPACYTFLNSCSTPNVDMELWQI